MAQKMKLREILLFEEMLMEEKDINRNNWLAKRSAGPVTKGAYLFLEDPYMLLLYSKFFKRMH